MTQKEFQAVFREQVRQCEGLLIQKAKEYTGDNPDRLSAFKAAAAIQDSTPQRALAGMMAKHIISIYDMCFTDRKTFELALSVLTKSCDKGGIGTSTRLKQKF